MDDNTPESLPEADRWRMLRDLAVLQVKLVVDGLRDLLLVPASVVAGILSLATGSDGRPGPQFYRLLAIGKQSEHWINLFGALKNAPPDPEIESRFPATDLDDVVSRVEGFVVDEYRRGGMTAQAKDRLDRALDALQRRGRGYRDNDEQ